MIFVKLTSVNSFNWKVIEAIETIDKLLVPCVDRESPVLVEWKDVSTFD